MSSAAWYDDPRCPNLAVYPPDLSPLEAGTAKIVQLQLRAQQIATSLASTVSLAALPWTGPASVVHTDNVLATVTHIRLAASDIHDMAKQLTEAEKVCDDIVASEYAKFEAAVAATPTSCLTGGSAVGVCAVG